MNISENIKYIGVNDHINDYFEGQFIVPNGMAYNSYLILDDKIAICDSVDDNFTLEWLNNLEKELNNKKPDYLIIHHMECDHSGSLASFLEKYPETILVGNAQTFNFFNTIFNPKKEYQKMIVKEGDILDLGKHQLEFIMAPMVHWPEVMMSYEHHKKILFSADAFGKFGANDVIDEEGWDCEARRYYFGIIGKFGNQVQNVLKKLNDKEINIICSLHGPILNDNISYYINKYNTWSSYQAEDKGITIVYSSIYGHNRIVVKEVAKRLEALGNKVSLFDLLRDDIYEALEDAFRYDRLILATTTYNTDIFPLMRTFINTLKEHNYQNRNIALIENGTWAPNANKVMKELLMDLKDINILENNLTIKASIKEEDYEKIDALVDELNKLN